MPTRVCLGLLHWMGAGFPKRKELCIWTSLLLYLNEKDCKKGPSMLFPSRDNVWFWYYSPAQQPAPGSFLPRTWALRVHSPHWNSAPQPPPQTPGGPVAIALCPPPGQPSWQPPPWLTSPPLARERPAWLQMAVQECWSLETSGARGNRDSKTFRVIKSPVLGPSPVTYFGSFLRALCGSPSSTRPLEQADGQWVGNAATARVWLEKESWDMLSLSWQRPQTRKESTEEKMTLLGIRIAF